MDMEEHMEFEGSYYFILIILWYLPDKTVQSFMTK